MPRSMIRRERPPGLRFRLGELVPIASRSGSGKGGGQQKRRTRPAKAFHFNVARPQADERQGDENYVVDQDATLHLQRRLGHEGGEFKPTRIPIIFLSADATGDGWYEARLYCHFTSCTSDQIIPGVGTFEEKSVEFLQSEEQHRKLEAQGLQHIIGDDPEYEGHPELFQGMATRYEADPSGHKRPHRVPCDPLLCEQFRNPDPKKACKPMGRIAFGMDWCPGRWYGSFVHGSWRSTSRMLSTLAEVAELYASKGRNLSRAQAWLCTEPVMTMAPDGKRYKQPCEHFEPDMEWLAEEIKSLPDKTYQEALPQISIEAVQALPSLNDLMSNRAERREIMSLHQPEIHAEIVDAEEAVWNRFSAHVTRAVFDAALARCDDDMEKLEADLKKYVPDAPVDAPEEVPEEAEAADEPDDTPEPSQTAEPDEVIDAEFTADDEAEPVADAATEEVDEETGWEAAFYEKAIGLKAKEAWVVQVIQDSPTRTAAEERLSNALEKHKAKADDAATEQADTPEQGGLPGLEE